jgi:tetratricopeptide (TPR) repeat protein
LSAVIEIQPKANQELVKALEFIERGDIEKADRIVNEHLMKSPDDAQALTLQVDILKKAKRIPAAYQIAKRATELRPDRSETWCSLGGAAQELWRLDEAVSCYRKAKQRATSNQQRAKYTNNIASSMLDGGQFVKAEPVCREGLTYDPLDSSLNHNLGLSLLAQRRWKEGWPYYSASLGTKSRRLVKYRPSGNEEPVWDGSKDKTVVIYGEQGLGDEICAASMLPDAIRDSKRVIIDCDHRLEGLFKRSFPQATVYGTRWSKQANWPQEDRSPDASISGFEIGRFYRNEDADFPGTPYLVPCPDRLAMWKSLFSQKQKPVIGIAWSGGIWQNASLYRQLPLKDWQPIFDAVDAHWVSLQYKDAEEEIKGTHVTQYKYATLTQDYDDTASVVAACDLVIAVQTSISHLSGALGVPCWTMIPKVSQWRYGEAYTDLPWYKSVRLFRQTNEWPVKQIADELRTHFR